MKQFKIEGKIEGCSNKVKRKIIISCMAYLHVIVLNWINQSINYIIHIYWRNNRVSEKENFQNFYKFQILLDSKYNSLKYVVNKLFLFLLYNSRILLRNTTNPYHFQFNRLLPKFLRVRDFQPLKELMIMNGYSFQNYAFTLTTISTYHHRICRHIRLNMIEIINIKEYKSINYKIQ